MVRRSDDNTVGILGVGVFFLVQFPDACTHGITQFGSVAYVYIDSHIIAYIHFLDHSLPSIRPPIFLQYIPCRHHPSKPLLYGGPYPIHHEYSLSIP